MTLPHTCAGPAISPEQALGRVADQPSIIMLAGGASRRTHLIWNARATAVRSHDELSKLVGISASGGAPLAENGWGQFSGGWFIQLDYEFPRSPGTLWTVDAVASWDGTGACRLSARAQDGLERMRRDLAAPERPIRTGELRGPLSPAWNVGDYSRRVAAIRSYIEAGDVYQANLTMPFTGTLLSADNADIALWCDLLRNQDAAYGAFIRHDGRSILSLSPECFLRIDGGRITSEPIKGTRRRAAGDGPRAAQELLQSPKNRAELAMIVDLMRNDLGRVARAGSVAVVDGARIMELAYVHHLVGVVSAELRPEIRFGDIIAAAFPPGSVTGAPKIRAMQIIRELEQAPRGPYCGAYGWINDSGQAQLAVAIRTLVMGEVAHPGDRALSCELRTLGTGHLVASGEAGISPTRNSQLATCNSIRIHAGSGIVGDSDAASEWDEVHAKASPLAAAFGVRL
jgi:anthranilate/para-aminobenzoate synthase component I